MDEAVSSNSMRKAMAAFRLGRRCYEAQQFVLARKYAADYRQKIDYRAFSKEDRRPVGDGSTLLWSVVIVSYGTGKGLLDCLNSIFSQSQRNFEVILVDNGKNEAIRTNLKDYPLLHVTPPQNMLPSEGRNIGSHFARGRYLAFVDDDGLIPENYLREGERVLLQPKVIGARGRIVPKTQGGRGNSHYDLGPEPKPALLSLEGNMVINRDLFLGVGGFDLLMFGHEGKELGVRLDKAYKGYHKLYWPTLELKHDYAEVGRLDAKRTRQATGAAYLDFMYKDIAKIHSGVGLLTRNNDTAFTKGCSLIVYSDVDISCHFEVALEAMRDDITQIIWVCSDPRLFLDRVVRLSKFSKVILMKASGERNVDWSSVFPKIISEYHCFLRAEKVENDYNGGDGDLIKFSLKSALLKSLKFRTPNVFDSKVERFIDFSDCVEIGVWSDENEVPDRCLDNSFNKFNCADFDEIISGVAHPGGGEERLLSVIIPVYNKEPFLSKCLESLQPLEGVDLEVIFVDDQSTDGGLLTLKNLANNNPFVRLIRAKKNGGASRARNIGMSVSKGRFISFLDADDTLDSHEIKKILSRPDLLVSDIIRAKISGVSESGSRVVLAKENTLHSEERVGIRWADDSSLWFYWYFTACLFNRKFLEKNMIRFPEGVRNEDPYFLCRSFLAAKNISLVNSVVYYYTVGHADGKRTMSSDFLSGWVSGYFNIFQLIQNNEDAMQYFLSQFPSLLKHSSSIVKIKPRDEAKHLLKKLKIMFNHIRVEMVNNPKLVPGKAERTYSSSEKDYILSLKNDSVDEIYKKLLTDVEVEVLA